MLDETDRVLLRSPSLADVILESQKLCRRSGVPFDPLGVFVTTDYGSYVLIYLEKPELENEND